MSPTTLVALAALLLAVLLLLAAALLWQEARSRGTDEGPVYVLEDAVRFISGRLPAEGGLSRSDIRRILEWELYYLQGLAQSQRWRPVETVAGGADPAVEYIVDEISTKHGVTYAPEDVRRVLQLEADYLASIGAVGEPVEEDAMRGDQR